MWGLRAKNCLMKNRASQRGEGRKEALAEKPLDFEKKTALLDFHA